MMAFQGAAEIGGIGVGEKPRSRVRIVAVAQDRATDGTDLETMRALWHM
jgi:predicted SpoU family rRNA methylase